MKRIAGDREDILRIEEIVARYSHLLFSARQVLDYVSLDEIAFIGNRMASLPSSREVYLAPYSFADLYLSDNPTLQTTFNKLTFSLQCKVLDTSRVFREAQPPYAMVALDWESGSVQLLALSANQSKLEELSLAFLTDPLTVTMVDERYEPQKAYLLTKAKELLLDWTSNKRIGIYSVTCSEELFVNTVFGPILDCTFSLVLGEQKDLWGRAIPSHISEPDQDCLFQSPRT
ncbi:MAG: hypothetical protein JEY71_06245 [Sphaerochaeta sp.]|nr:hypothetical protein [Sphaerochaeta sp.]